VEAYAGATQDTGAAQRLLADETCRPGCCEYHGLSMCQPVNASTRWAMSAHSCNCMQDGVGKHGNY
jgi:hypothetical protein